MNVKQKFKAVVKKQVHFWHFFLSGVFILVFLTACSSAFVAARQDDVITQIDVWAIEHEYGKAFKTIDYVKSTHPQYSALQGRKKSLRVQADDYAATVEQQIVLLMADRHWAEALDLLDQAQAKYAGSKSLHDTEKMLKVRQAAALRIIDNKITVERSRCLLQLRPLYRSRLTVDPRNKKLKKKLVDLDDEARLLAADMTLLARDAMNKKHYKRAKIHIMQAIALHDSDGRQKLLAQLK